jgi:uncharacterized repeat protein (TIGR03803 family)
MSRIVNKARASEPRIASCNCSKRRFNSSPVSPVIPFSRAATPGPRGIPERDPSALLSYSLRSECSGQAVSDALGYKSNSGYRLAIRPRKKISHHHENIAVPFAHYQCREKNGKGRTNMMQLKRQSEGGFMRAAKHLANGACAGILGVTVATALFAQAGHRGFHQIYNFGGPVAPSALTGSGNTLYGTTQQGGSQGVGVVYAITLSATGAEPRTYTTLYNFGSTPTDGAVPFGVTIGGFSGGLPVLYGTTYRGGSFNNGTVFSLVPPQTPGGAWTEQILHSFDGTDGGVPEATVVADMGTGELPVLYGTTLEGGASGNGAIFSLTPPTTPGGAWTENVLHSFGASGDEASFPTKIVMGSGPGGPVLYGFTAVGGTNENGVVYSLAEVDNTWTYSVIYNRPPSSVTSEPTDLTIGGNGVLYGTENPAFGSSGAGDVYSLTPPTSDGDSWTENTLYAFGTIPDDGSSPQSVLVGGNGHLYGVTADGGLVYGTVFALTPPASSGGPWTEDVIYRFPFDGVTSAPVSLIMGPQGTLYGTTYYGDSTVFGLQP